MSYQLANLLLELGQEYLINVCYILAFAWQILSINLEVLNSLFNSLNYNNDKVKVGRREDGKVELKFQG